MAVITVFSPEQGATFPYKFVAATGKYRHPNRIKGTLTQLNGDNAYVGKRLVLRDNLWALFFGPVEGNSKYLLHIFDSENPDVDVDPIKIKVAGGIGIPTTFIISPAGGETLYDRAVPMVGFTAATEITVAAIRHGSMSLDPSEPRPIRPYLGFWGASFTIPSDYPCPGDSPDYTAYAEDSDSSSVQPNQEIKLDLSLCPETERKARKGKASKKRSKKKKKKTRGKKK